MAHLQALYKLMRVQSHWDHFLSESSVAEETINSLENLTSAFHCWRYSLRKRIEVQTVEQIVPMDITVI